MALVVAFIVFMVAMVGCLALGYSTIIALLIGFVAFVAVGKTKGFKVIEVLKMAFGGVKDSLVVIEIMFMIGFITAVWRASGTITFFVYYGVKIVTPPLFILLAFVMCCILSYILGTSFSVSGTLGVILMALSAGGGVNPLITAGAIMSGIYFGDRCAPASSSAILVANVTKTKLMDNVKTMFVTGMLPLIIALGLYTFVSVRNPMQAIDEAVMTDISKEFGLSLLTLIPALFILILPLFKLDIRWAFVGSIVSGFVLMVTLQHIGFLDAIKYCIVGFTPESESLRSILSGGGLVSMLSVCCIIILSCSYSGIFKGTDMLKDIQDKISTMMSKTGRYLMMVILAFMTSMVFCSQTISIMLCNDLMSKPYLNSGGSRKELAIDIENSTVMISAFIPWNVACAVPLEMLDVGAGALKYSYLLFLIPFIYIFTKKRWFEDRVD